MPITIFDSDTIPRDRRAELEAAVVAAGRATGVQTARRHPGEVAPSARRASLSARWRSRRRAAGGGRRNWPRGIARGQSAKWGAPARSTAPSPAHHGCSALCHPNR